MLGGDAATPKPADLNGGVAAAADAQCNMLLLEQGYTTLVKSFETSSWFPALIESNGNKWLFRNQLSCAKIFEGILPLDGFMEIFTDYDKQLCEMIALNVERVKDSIAKPKKGFSRGPTRRTNQACDTAFDTWGRRSNQANKYLLAAFRCYRLLLQACHQQGTVRHPWCHAVNNVPSQNNDIKNFRALKVSLLRVLWGRAPDVNNIQVKTAGNLVTALNGFHRTVLSPVVEHTERGSAYVLEVHKNLQTSFATCIADVGPYPMRSWTV
jgi:hypothetical protein